MAIGLVVSFAGAGRMATAQVVQLPSMHTFSYSGAVSVPDQGQAYLGGVRRQGTGSTTRGAGPLAGRAAGGQTGGSATIVSASVIDLQAMDEAILNQSAASATGRPANYSGRDTGTPVVNTITPQLYARRMGADQLPAPSDRNAWEIALGGGGAANIGPANAIVSNDSTVRFFMQRAKEADNVGRIAAARVYYRMAYERLSPAQRARLQEYQAKANAAAQPGQATAANGAAAAPASPAAAASPAGTASAAGMASPAAAGGNAPAASAAGSPAGEMPAGGANPFDSPF